MVHSDGAHLQEYQFSHAFYNIYAGLLALLGVTECSQVRYILTSRFVK